MRVQKDFASGKAENEVNDNDILHDEAKKAAKVAAAAKKAHDEAERKRKFNPFDGLVHEDDGSSWNKGDGVQVRGVNKFLKTHKRSHEMPENDDSVAEQKEKAKEIEDAKQ